MRGPKPIQMNRCIYSLQAFEEADAEHILQNALGARWTSRVIVCNEVQAAFGHTIDPKIADALGPIRNFLEIRSGRRKPPPTLPQIVSDDGQVFDLEPGCHPHLHEPIVKTYKHSSGRKIAELLLGHSRHLEWALSKLRREIPNLSVDESILWDSRQTVQLPESFAIRINPSIISRSDWLPV